MSKIIEKLSQLKVIPVIAIDNSDDIIRLGELLTHNKLPVAEITLRTTAALSAIAKLRKSQPDILIGVGSVKNPEQVRDAVKAGADFIVTAGLNPKTAKACKDLNIPLLAGINNPSHLEQAISEFDMEAVKFFPAEQSGGIAMLKAISGPYADIKVMPTGGINKNNIMDYLQLPTVFACGGSWMVDRKLIAEGKWEQINQLIAESVEVVKGA